MDELKANVVWTYLKPDPLSKFTLIDIMVSIKI